MKRRVIKQGHNTLTITLPSEWVKKLNIQSGEELDLSEISHRAVSGVMVLTIRKFLLKAVNYLGSIILARLLAPEIFGIFAIVSFIITFFGFFSDVGLGAALIQKKDKLSSKDLAVTFTLQQILVVTVTGLIWLAAPFVSSRAGDYQWI